MKINFCLYISFFCKSFLYPLVYKISCIIDHSRIDDLKKTHKNMVLVMSILHALTSGSMQITHESVLIATVMKHMNNTVDLILIL